MIDRKHRKHTSMLLKATAHRGKSQMQKKKTRGWEGSWWWAKCPQQSLSSNPVLDKLCEEMVWYSCSGTRTWSLTNSMCVFKSLNAWFPTARNQWIELSGLNQSWIRETMVCWKSFKCWALESTFMCHIIWHCDFNGSEKLKWFGDVCRVSCGEGDLADEDGWRFVFMRKSLFSLSFSQLWILSFLVDT